MIYRDNIKYDILPLLPIGGFSYTIKLDIQRVFNQIEVAWIQHILK